MPQPSHGGVDLKKDQRVKINVCSLQLQSATAGKNREEMITRTIVTVGPHTRKPIHTKYIKKLFEYKGPPNIRMMIMIDGDSLCSLPHQ